MEIDQKLRILGVDDLYILALFTLPHATGTQIANRLGLTQPAVVRRMAKIQEVIPNVWEKDGRCLKLTNIGESLAIEARDFLQALSLY